MDVRGVYSAPVVDCKIPAFVQYVDSTLVHSKKSLLIMKLGSFQNASIEIKQISFFYQQNRFTVIVVLMITVLILAFAKVGLVYISYI